VSRDPMSIEQSFRILERNMAWVAAADSKVAPLLAISTGMLGAVAASLPKPVDLNLSAVVSSSLAVLLLIATIVCLTLAVFPRLHGPSGSLIYFGGIASMNLTSYIKKMTTLKQDQLQSEVIVQTHRNAEIAVQKHKFIRSALICLFMGIIPWSVSLLLLYTNRK